MLTRVTKLWTVLRLRQSTTYSSIVWEPECLLCICVCVCMSPEITADDPESLSLSVWPYMCAHCAFMQPSMWDRTFTSMADCCAFMGEQCRPRQRLTVVLCCAVCYTTTMWTSLTDCCCISPFVTTLQMAATCRGLRCTENLLNLVTVIVWSSVQWKENMLWEDFSHAVSFRPTETLIKLVLT